MNAPSTATAVRPTATQSAAPRFEFDTTWPKPLPEGWIGGQLPCVYVDHNDHILIVNRGDITEEEKETCIRAPAVMIFDLEGKLIGSWGDWDLLPSTPHSCAVDRDNNVWITANGDGMVQKYSYDGKLILQIGKKGVFDTVDGAKKSKNLNEGRDKLNKPAGIACDPENGDVYFADGYGNRRIVVFDKMGNFKRNVWIRTGTPTLPDKRGTAWWTAFSPDQEQKYLYVMNGRNEQVHVLDHASGTILSSFGRPGHQLGHFTHGHSLAVDSKGNLYIAETNWGRRVHRFNLVK